MGQGGQEVAWSGCAQVSQESLLFVWENSPVPTETSVPVLNLKGLTHLRAAAQAMVFFPFRGAI